MQITVRNAVVAIIAVAFIGLVWVAFSVAPASASDVSDVTINNPETNAGKVEANSGASTVTEITGLDADITFDGTVIPKNTDARIATVPQVTPPAVIGGNPCTVGVSLGGSVVGFGISGAVSKEGVRCELRQSVALLFNLGYAEESLVLLCMNNKDVEEMFAALGRGPCASLVAELPEQLIPITPSGSQRAVPRPSDGVLTGAGAVNTSSAMPTSDPSFCADDRLYNEQLNLAWDEISPSCRARRVAVLAGATR